MDGDKTYRFTVRWGEAPHTDDAEGEVIATSAARPAAAEIEAALPALPRRDRCRCRRPSPRSRWRASRAYDLARDGETVELAPRPVRIDRFDLVERRTPTTPSSRCSAARATYMRSLAATSPGPSAPSAMSSHLRRPRSAGSRKSTRFRWKNWRLWGIVPAASAYLLRGRDRAGRHPGAGPDRR